MVDATGFSTFAAMSAPASAEPARLLQDAASEFEGTLLRTWLREVRNSSLAPEPTASAGYLEIADDHLARVFAAAGGAGLARQLERQVALAREPAGLNTLPAVAVTGSRGN